MRYVDTRQHPQQIRYGQLAESAIREDGTAAVYPLFTVGGGAGGGGSGGSSSGDITGSSELLRVNNDAVRYDSAGPVVLAKKVRAVVVRRPVVEDVAADLSLLLSSSLWLCVYVSAYVRLCGWCIGMCPTLDIYVSSCLPTAPPLPAPP